MKTILIGYDGSDASERALARAAQLAEAFGARVVVTSVAPVLVGAGRGIGPLDPADPPAEHVELLAHATGTLAAHGITAESQLAIGNPSTAIVEAADTVDADLIIVGTRELGFFERALGGSVSEGVLHRARRDVLVVH